MITSCIPHINYTDEILRDADSSDVALLVVGDPLGYVPTIINTLKAGFHLEDYSRRSKLQLLGIKGGQGG